MSKQELFADIVKKHTKRADIIRTFSWGTLNFTTQELNLAGTCASLKKVYSDVMDLMDNFDMMTYAMPVEFKLCNKDEPGTTKLRPINGWQLSFKDRKLSLNKH